VVAGALLVLLGRQWATVNRCRRCVGVSNLVDEGGAEVGAEVEALALVVFVQT